MRKNVVAFLSASVLAILGTTLIIFAASGDTRIADAAMKRDKDAVRSLIKQAADVNTSQGDGMTALHWAALNGDAELAQMLVYAGANVKATTRLGGYSPLFMAAKAGVAPVVDVLLKAGASPKTPALDGITPLMMAASSGNADAVRKLIAAGADVNAMETERGQTALAFAAAFNQADAIKVLLQHGADVNRKSKQMKPASRPQRGPAQQQQGQAPTPPAVPAQAAQTGQQPAQPAQPAQNQQQAARGGRGGNEATRGGGNPRGELTPLMYAARQNNFEAVRALVEGGAKLDEVSADRSTALLLATINGSFDIAKYLVERGANVMSISLDGATPLFALVNTQWAPKTDTPQPTTKYEATNYLDLMKLELDRGADPNFRVIKDLWYTQNKESTSSAGTTPFWKCAAVGDIDCMRLLISRGADPRIPNVDGITPLLVAAGAGFHGNNELTTPSGRLATVKYLVEELNADVNLADTAEGSPRDDSMNTSRAAGGFTALHNAASRGDNEMILYLVSKGAKVDAVARNGTTVVDSANGPRQRIQPYQDTVALLQMLGAKNSHKCISC